MNIQSFGAGIFFRKADCSEFRLHINTGWDHVVLNWLTVTSTNMLYSCQSFAGGSVGQHTVGVDVAKEIAEKGLTLEEYLGK